MKMHSCVLENTVLFACAAGGLPQTAPEGLCPSGLPFIACERDEGGTKANPCAHEYKN